MPHLACVQRGFFRMGNVKESKMGKMTKYHIGVILTGALLCLGPATLSMNIWGVFLVPISTELGVSESMFSLQPSLLYLAAALFAPIGGKLIERFDLRVVLTGASLVAALALLLDGVGTQLWHFYLVGALQGCSGVVLIALMLPNLISRWFEKKMGTVVGVCISMAGIGGALWAYVAGKVIIFAGWRASCLALAVICLLVSLPACIFLLRNRPSDVGVLPYGASEGSVSTEDSKKSFGVPAKIAFGSAVFLCFSLGIGLLDGVIGLANLAPSYVYYLESAGFTSMTYEEVVMAASMVVLCTQVAQASFKVLLGILADKSVKLAFVIALVSGIGATVCFLLAQTLFGLVFAGAVMIGALFAVLDVLSPVLMKDFFGDRDYPRIYARFAMITNLVPAFAVLAFSAISERSWLATFAVGGICLAITLASGLFAMARSKALKPYFSEAE